MYSESFVSIFLRLPSDLHRYVLSYVPTRQQALMMKMETWVSSLYPRDTHIHVSSSSSCGNDSSTIGWSIHKYANDPFSTVRHEFITLPCIRSHIVERDHHIHTFYVATYKRMRRAVKEFNEDARKGCKHSWLRYKSILWEDAVMPVRDDWYGVKYYICWRETLSRHIFHQLYNHS